MKMMILLKITEKSIKWQQKQTLIITTNEIGDKIALILEVIL